MERDQYLRFCRLDCDIVRATQDIVVRRWTTVGAVAMHEALGVWVHDRLTEPGPVIIVENGTWIMLTDPTPADLYARWQEALEAAKAVTVSADSVVILPGPCTRGRRWLIPPLSGDRPHPGTVFAEIGRYEKHCTRSEEATAAMRGEVPALPRW
ncbi:hypothetical protein [Nocardia higoensis]|uniref:hypothetical protein n=1 Tax=Nocardia higoensis TaxID=228599 RepID=UPI0005941B81|nr:hypothetical protein [Nocardia higoensis]